MSTITPFQAGPFPNNDILHYGLQFIDIADIASSALVCKAWEAAVQYHHIWLQLFANEKIPRIEGRTTTAKEDFRFMRSITYSAQKSGWMGKFVGVVPKISANVFELLKTAMDPYEPDKKMSETFVIVVEPTNFHVPYHAGLFDDLVKKGDFDTKSEEVGSFKKNGILIPYSLKNLKILAGYAAAKKGKGPVFNHAYLGAENLQKILDQCSAIAKTVRVSIMRIEVPPQSCNESYDQQKGLLEEKGLEMVSLCTRFYFNLGKHICRDKQAESSSIFSQTSDEVELGENLSPVVISEPGFPGGICFHFSKSALEEVGAASVVRGPGH